MKKPLVPYILMVLFLVCLVAVPIALPRLQDLLTQKLSTPKPSQEKALSPVGTLSQAEPQTGGPTSSTTTPMPSPALTAGTTPTQESSPQVFPTPVVPPTSIPWTSLPVIEPGNASELAQLHRFGMGTIGKLAWSPDGIRLVIATSLGIWSFSYDNLQTGQLIESPISVFILSISFHPDGKTLVTASSDQLLRFWDLETLSLKGSWESPQNIRALAFSPDGKFLVTGGDDKVLRVYDLETGQVLKMLAGHSEAIHSIAISPDGRTIVSAAGQESLILWEFETGLTVKKLGISIKSLAYQPDGKVLVAGSTAGKIYLLDPGTGALLKTLDQSLGYISTLAFNKNGTLLASSGYGEVYLWDVQTWQIITVLKAGNYESESLDFGGSQDNLLVAHVFGDCNVLVWDITSGQELSPITGFAYHEPRVHLLPDGRILAADGYDVVFVWDSMTGQIVSRLNKHPYNPDIVFNQDGTIVATADSGYADISTLRVWSTFSGGKLHEFKGVRYSGEILFSPDGRLLAQSGINPGDGTKLWDLKTGLLQKDFAGAEGGTRSLAFDPSSRVLAAGLGNGEVLFWNVEKCSQASQKCGTLIAVGQKHLTNVSSLAFSPDGQVLASGSYDHQVILWKVADGTPLVMFSEHSDDVIKVRFSPSGAHLASTSRNGEVFLWDVQARKLACRLGGNKSTAYDIAFSPNRPLLASISYNDIRMWDISTCKELVTLKGSGSSIIFSADSKLLVSADIEGTVRIFGVLPETPPSK